MICFSCKKAQVSSYFDLMLADRLRLRHQHNLYEVENLFLVVLHFLLMIIISF